ncbi:Acetyltransferase [Mucinivorans hirudinis]|uniref:Acetyltransferase n=1 Tax=Mucinivorans hirudinis TaxID=1433126 RepID=A0A060R6R7_9BACT|nr:Acetyltransferase [Mucinivorans hirudinis]
MILTPTKTENIPAIMNLVAQAQSYLAKQGIDQWQDGYPDEQTIKNDIAQGESYVVYNNESEVIATIVVSFEAEDTYRTIEGQWLTENPYCVMHRMAIRDDYKGRGVTYDIFRKVEQMAVERGIKSIRLDTHEQNIAMRRISNKLGYRYCGIIYVRGNSPRLAYEKILK